MLKILQHFRSSLSYQCLKRSLFCLFLSGRFTNVLLSLYANIVWQRMPRRVCANAQTRKSFRYSLTQSMDVGEDSGRKVSTSCPAGYVKMCMLARGQHLGLSIHLDPLLSMRAAKDMANSAQTRLSLRCSTMR